jgi:hypothetical protein
MAEFEDISSCIDLLHEGSALDPMEQFGTLRLRGHQRAALHACKELEAGRCRAPLADNVDRLNARLGAFCDQPGAGKSAVMLALASSQGDLPHPVRCHSLCGGMMSFLYHDTREPLRCTVIVVPHVVVMQWAGYADQVGVEVLVLSKSAHFRNFGSKLEGARIVIVSSTFYKTLSNKLMDTFSHSFILDRLIVDEADSICLGHSCLIPARMVWVVTGSLKNMLLPYNMHRYDPDTNRAICVSSGIRTRSIKVLFEDLARGMAVRERGAIFVVSDPEFVDACLSLPPLTAHYVRCRTPFAIHMLSGLVDRHIMTALHTDDTELALSYIPNKGDEVNIVRLLHKRWTESIAQMEAAIQNLQGGEINADMVASMRRKVVTFQKQADSVQERVNGTDSVCGVCFEETMHHMTITPCCANKFCFACVSRWVAQDRTCPTCRVQCETADLHVVVDQDAVDRSASVPSTDLPGKQESIIELILALTTAQEARVLVCCANSGVFQPICAALAGHRVSSGTIKGNSASIRAAVERFREGELRTMFVSNDGYCAGINLEFVSDVIIYSRFDEATERQVISRAQRFSRASALRVHYLVHDNELGAQGALPVKDCIAALNL